MAKNYPLVGRQKVAAILETFCRGCACSIEDKHCGSNKLAVKAISQRITAKCRHYKPQGIDRFASMQCQYSKSSSTY